VDVWKGEMLGGLAIAPEICTIWHQLEYGHTVTYGTSMNRHTIKTVQTELHVIRLGIGALSAAGISRLLVSLTRRGA